MLRDGLSAGRILFHLPWLRDGECVLVRGEALETYDDIKNNICTATGCICLLRWGQLCPVCNRQGIDVNASYGTEKKHKIDGHNRESNLERTSSTPAISSNPRSSSPLISRLTS